MNSRTWATEQRSRNLRKEFLQLILAYHHSKLLSENWIDQISFHICWFIRCMDLHVFIQVVNGSVCTYAYKNFKFFDNDSFSIKLWAVHLKESNCTLHTKRMSLHKTCNYFLMWVRMLSSFLLAKTSVNQKGFADKQRASSFVRKLEIKGMVWQDHAQVHILFQWLVHYYVMTFSIGNIMTGYHKYHPHVIWMQQTGHVDLRNFLLDLTMNGTVL